MQARLPRTTNSTGPQTRERYTRALARWDALLAEFRVSGFEEKSEEEQDFILCELVFEVRAYGGMSFKEKVVFTNLVVLACIRLVEEKEGGGERWHALRGDLLPCASLSWLGVQGIRIWRRHFGRTVVAEAAPQPSR